MIEALLQQINNIEQEQHDIIAPYLNNSGNAMDIEDLLHDMLLQYYRLKKTLSDSHYELFTCYQKQNFANEAVQHWVKALLLSNYAANKYLATVTLEYLAKVTFKKNMCKRQYLI